MNRRFLARRRLMQAACASLVAPWVHASGDDGGTAPDANLFPVLQAKVKTAMALLSNKQFLAAQPLLAEALAVVDADPARRWPWRVYVLPTYGFAELGLGRTQVAVDALRLAVQAEERIAAEQLQPFAQLSAAMDRAMGKQLLKVEYGRQMLTAIGAPGTLRTVGELPYDTDHSAAELWFTTARALHANGDVEELARFYRQHVAPRRAATEDVPAVLAQEYRHFKIGLLLWQAGQHDAAAEAFAAALDSNSQRFSHMDQTSTTMEAVWSAFVMRRTILAAQLEQARQNGALDSAVPVLLARLVSAKGGGVRYHEAMLRQLHASTDAQLRQNQAQLRQVEDQIAALPQAMRDLGLFMKLALMNSLQVGQVAGALRIETLPLPDRNGIDLAAVQRGLGNDAVIGFFVYAPPSATSFAPAPPRYLRYCLTAASISVSDLGPQRALEQAVHGYRSELMSKTMAASRAGGSALAQRLLRDLPPAALAAAEWILDPDAALHLLPFDALPDAQGQPLALTRSCRHVNSLLQLLPDKTAAAPASASGAACIFANPAYGAGLAQPATAATRFAMAGEHAAGAQRIVAVAPLPDTRGEADAVSAGLHKLGMATRRYEGEAASMAAMQASVSPVVLHIAAHAILGQDTGPAPDDGAGGEAESMDLLLPGRRAGLLLSNKGQAELMLAKDIARLPLHGTQLVVLSACNTGNGAVLPGEGLASLRRAVELAGARSSITSLWSVPSEASTELMRAMYGHIGNGMAPGAALHRAKQAMIRLGRPPLDWAGFVFAGTDAALVAPRPA